MRIPSNMKTESFAWLGDSPNVREWVGSRIHKGMPELSFAITNKLYEGTLDFDYFTYTSPTGGAMASARASQLGQKMSSQPYRLALDVMVANGLCYDGQNFFDTDHTDPGAGYTTSQSNAVTVTGLSSATACTALDAVKVVRAIHQHFLGIKDSEGDPSFGDELAAIRPLLIVPIAVSAVFNQAKNSSTIIDSGSPVDNDVQGTFDVVISDKASASVVYALALGAGGRFPFIFLEHTPASLRDNADRVLSGETPILTVMASSAHSVGYGDWRCAVKATRST
jgi:phage major head subunit gpT-like protein